MGDAVVTSLVGAPVSLFSLQPEISVHAALVGKSGTRGRQTRRGHGEESSFHPQNAPTNCQD